MRDEELFNAEIEVRKARIKFNKRRISIHTFGRVLRSVWLSKGELFNLENDASLHR